MQNSLLIPKIKPGNLIQTKKIPYLGYYFFYERESEIIQVKFGTIGIILRTDGKSNLGHKIIHVLFDYGSQKILSTRDHNDHLGNPLWCDILQ